MKPRTHHFELTGTLREELALYAFGLLEGEHATEVAGHLEAGCSVCNEEFQAVAGVMVELASAVVEVAPADSLKQRLLMRINSEKQGQEEQCGPGMYVVRSGSGKWRQTRWDGIAWMRLHHDQTTGLTTSLVRVDPGARYPAHRHRGVEQSWVVEGSCRIGSVTIRAGDFACATAGSEHGILESDDGCVLLMVTSAKDEVLA